MTLEEFIKKYDGKGIDYDGKYKTQCFMAGSMVLMADGSYKPIEDIVVGDRVQSYSGGFNKVIKLFRRKANTLKVRTHLADLRVTPEHPFLMKSGSFLPITETINGEVPELYLPQEFEESGLTDNELMFLGFWLGDGNLRRYNDGRNAEVVVTFNEYKDKSFLSKLKILSRYRRHQDTDNAFVGNVSWREHPKLVELIRNCYDDNGNKVIRHNFTNREWMLIIKGLCMADGCYKHNSWKITNTSKELLLTIQNAAIRCGYTTCSIREGAKAGTPTTLNGKHIIRKKDAFYLTLSRHNKKLGFANRVLDIQKLGKQEVYNLEVDGNHTYIVENYIVHNCVDLYRQYVKEVLGFPQSPPVEGAKDIWDTYLPEYYKRIENTPYGVPEKGDIVIWGTKIGKYGHVAIFLEGDAKKFKSFDQNFPVGSLCHIQEHTYTGVLGWLRPIIKTMELPDWFRTLLQERGLSLDREGEFRAFWEKALKYDNDIRELQEQVKTTNEVLSQKTLEISMQMDKIQQLQNKVDELQELYNRVKQERDDFEWQARNALSNLENLQDQLKKQEVEIQELKEEIKRLKDDQMTVLNKIPLSKLITEVLVRVFGKRR